MKTMADVRAANKAARKHFFDRATMKFFGSRVESGLLRGGFFITSEQPPHGGRVFSIRVALKDGRVETLNNLAVSEAFPSKAEAMDTLRFFRANS